MKTLQVDTIDIMLFGHMHRITLHKYVQNYMHACKHKIFTGWSNVCIVVYKYYCAGSKLFTHINYFVYKVCLSTRMRTPPPIL